MFRPLILASVVAATVLADSAIGQQPSTSVTVPPPPMSAAQQDVLAKLPPDTRIYEEFRYWSGFQSPVVRAAASTHYDIFLAQQGVPPAERANRLKIIEAQGRRLEIDRWNRILTAERPTFNTKPNAFLVEVIKGRRPGRALDVGMGQGRNALYLAEQQWDVTGFDPAEQAIAAAQAEAKRRNLKLTVSTVGAENFDWGKDRWDLIVLSYVTVRPFVRHIVDSLAPGGLIVLEASHRDATKKTSIGGAVVYDSNELLHMFDDLRIVRYEDIDAEPDFGPRGQVSRAVPLGRRKAAGIAIGIVAVRDGRTPLNAALGSSKEGYVGVVEISLRPFQIVLKCVGEGLIAQNLSEGVDDLECERDRIVRLGIVLVGSR